MEGLILFLLVLAVAAVVLYPIWRRYYSSTLTTTIGTTTTTTTPCTFPTTTVTAKGGLIDLSACTQDVYIVHTSKAKIHFIKNTNIETCA